MSSTSHPASDPQRPRVVVAGAGPAGVVAALAAARAGAAVILLEQHGFVGGMAGTGLGFQAFYDSADRRVVGGIPWELVKQMMATGSCAVLKNYGPTDDEFYESRSVRFSPEAFKRVATEALLAAGVDVLCRSVVTGVIREAGVVTGVTVENKSGRSEVSGNCIIDCTGDGDIAARAGVRYELGRRGDGVLQPMTMLFSVSHVDVGRATDAGALELGPWRVVEPPQLRDKYRSYVLDLAPWADRLAELTPTEVAPVSRIWVHDHGDGIFYTGNFVHIRHLDGSNGEQLSRGEVVGRTMVWRLVDLLRQHVPGFRNVHLVQIATHLGVRETRRVHGHYYLTAEDALSGRQFDDSVAQCANMIDIHDPDASDFVRLDAGSQIRDGRSFGMPYRALVPQGVDGLLMAGRCVSGSREAQGSFRVMATCMAMGQAAGTAAALSALTGIAPRLIDRHAVRARLIEAGAIVDSPQAVAA